MLKAARQLLFDEYNEKIALIPLNSIYQVFCNEKIKHSLQVLGAANYIISHEEYFFQQSSELIEKAKTAALLHDIARFDEAVYRFKNKNADYNHGLRGAEFLVNSPFSCPQIVLPVKYHGEIYIDNLYTDNQWQNLTSKQQQEVEQIAKLVRDADKIANLHLFFSNNDHLEKLVLSELSLRRVEGENVRPEILNEFLHNHLLVSDVLANRTERLLQLLAWVFDLNYHSSFVFCKKNKVFQRMFEYFLKTCPDYIVRKQVVEKLKQFVFEKQGIET